MTKTHPARRLIRATTTLLALGTAICGAVIVSTAWTLSAKLDGQYKTNLDALTVTINELDLTILALRKDTESFNNYLNTLRAELHKTDHQVDSLDSQVSDLVKLVGKNAPQALGDSSKAVSEASKKMKESANVIGMVPGKLEVIKSTRQSLYDMAGNLMGAANALKSVSEEIGDLTEKIGDATTNSLESLSVVIESTAENLKILQKGSLERLPATLEALSSQLHAHLRLIESSYDLVRQVTKPIIALGLALFFLGLRGMFVNHDGARGRSTIDEPV